VRRGERRQPGMMVHSYNPSTWEVEAGRWQVPGQPGLQIQTLPIKRKDKRREKGRKGRKERRRKDLRWISFPEGTRVREP
jgi:hypothetical protein